jgi:hypothetical protein
MTSVTDGKSAEEDFYGRSVLVIGEASRTLIRTEKEATLQTFRVSAPHISRRHIGSTISATNLPTYSPPPSSAPSDQFSRKSPLIPVSHINTGMTTMREMENAYPAQQEIIAALREIGDNDLAHRLERCMTARQQRCYGSGWPYSCRSAGCFWCRRAMIRGWWAGFLYWAKAATTSSLAIIPLQSPSGLHDTVRRSVAFAGLVDGDGKALAMISHEGVDRRELQDRLRQRWPEMVLKDLGGEEPVWEMTAEDAADLGARRRGVEPLRIVIMPQQVMRVRVTPAPVVEIAPMPVVI